MLKYLIVFCLLAAPALAQQVDPGQGRVAPQAVPTVAETAIQINNIIGQWAQTLLQQARTQEELQKQLTAANARIKELEPKPEAKKD